MALRFIERHTSREDLGVEDTSLQFKLGRVADQKSEQVKRVELDKETDPKRLAARERNIKLFKETPVYKRYVRLVPKDRRRYRRVRGSGETISVPEHPSTPDLRKKYSKRMWDGLLKAWKRDVRKHYATEEDRGPGTSNRNGGEGASGKPAEQLPSTLDYIFENSGGDKPKQTQEASKGQTQTQSENPDADLYADLM